MQVYQSNRYCENAFSFCNNEKTLKDIKHVLVIEMNIF